MLNNCVSRIGLSVQGIGMAWCKCHKKDGVYIVEDFRESQTSFRRLEEILKNEKLVYLVNKVGIQPHLKITGLAFYEVKVSREEVEMLISSNINEGKILIGEKPLSLLKRVLEQDYLIQERQTPAAQALHFGLGELIFQSTKPLACVVGVGTPLQIFDPYGTQAKAEIRRRNEYFDSDGKRPTYLW